VITTDENPIVVMLGLEHRDAAIRCRTDRAAGIAWDRDIGLVLKRVGRYRVRAAGAGDRGDDNGLILGVAGRVDDGKLLVGPMRTVSEEVMTIAWIEPDLVRAPFVNEDSPDSAGVLIDNGRIANAAWNRRRIAAEQYLWRRADSHALRPCAIRHGDVERSDDRHAARIDHDNIAVRRIAAATVDFRDIQVDQPDALIPLALLDAICRVRTIAGQTVELYLFDDGISLRSLRRDEADERRRVGVVGDLNQVFRRVVTQFIGSIDSAGRYRV